MNGVSLWAIWLFGLACGACVPFLLVRIYHRCRRKWVRPSLLRLDTGPAQGATDAIISRSIDTARPK